MYVVCVNIFYYDVIIFMHLHMNLIVYEFCIMPLERILEAHNFFKSPYIYKNDGWGHYIVALELLVTTPGLYRQENPHIEKN